jgi:Holliday junction resolvasome RuvABC endonuclease subunit
MPAVLGIDVSSRQIDMVYLDETTDEATWASFTLMGATAFDRLRDVAQVMPSRAWYEQRGIYLAAIETPKTRFMPSAAAIFPVYGAVIAQIPRSLELWDIHPTAWRAGIGVPGNASKGVCAAAVHQLHIEAHYWSQDACDAYAVAYTARNTNQKGIEAA